MPMTAEQKNRFMRLMEIGSNKTEEWFGGLGKYLIERILTREFREKDALELVDYLLNGVRVNEPLIFHSAQMQLKNSRNERR